MQPVGVKALRVPLVGVETRHVQPVQPLRVPPVLPGVLQHIELIFPPLRCQTRFLTPQSRHVRVVFSV